MTSAFLLQPSAILISAISAISAGPKQSAGPSLNDQFCFFLNSPEQRQRILTYEEEQRRKAQEPVQSSLPFPETDNDDALPY